jgi:hypothetical protein
MQLVKRHCQNFQRAQTGLLLAPLNVGNERTPQPGVNGLQAMIESLHAPAHVVRFAHPCADTLFFIPSQRIASRARGAPTQVKIG